MVTKYAENCHMHRTIQVQQSIHSITKIKLIYIHYLHNGGIIITMVTNVHSEFWTERLVVTANLQMQRSPSSELFLAKWDWRQLFLLAIIPLKMRLAQQIPHGSHCDLSDLLRLVTSLGPAQLQDVTFWSSKSLSSHNPDKISFWYLFACRTSTVKYVLLSVMVRKNSLA